MLEQMIILSVFCVYDRNAYMIDEENERILI